MFKRHTEAEINELKREYWLQSKARGKNRFIWVEGVVPTLLTSFVGVLAVEVLAHLHSFSVRSIVFPAFILLPIGLLGGYLTGRWKWKDFEKKYPENSLRPGE